MNNSNYRLLQSIARYVDRGHLVLAAIALSAIVYSNHITNTVKTKTAETVNLEFDLKEANARVTVLEYEYFYGSPEAEFLSDTQLEFFVAYSEEKELMIRKQAIPILTAQIQALMPNKKGVWSKWHRKQWEAAGLPQPERLANVFYDAAKRFDHDPTFLISIMWKESRFRPDVCIGERKTKKGKIVKVRSSAGAMGCMQIMPQWVNELDYIETKKDLLQWDKNIMAGADIFRQYLDHKYGRGQMIRALYLYNYGPNRFAYKKRKKTKFNGYAEAIVRKVKRLKKIHPIDITVVKKVKVNSLNPL